MHAIDEVNVGSTGGAEQNFRAFRETARGMCGQVVKAEVSFSFYDHPSGVAVQQDTAKERWRELDCRAFKELHIEPFGASKKTRFRGYKLEH
jgi:uncharacterized protein (DUF2141 family)